MTLADVDWLFENDKERFRKYYYFVVEKMKAEYKANKKAMDKASGGSTGSDTFRFKDKPEDLYSDVGEQ